MTRLAITWLAGLLIAAVVLSLATWLYGCEPVRITTVEVTAYAMPVACFSDALEAEQRTLEGYVTSTLAPNLASVGYTEFVDHAGTYVRARDGRRCVFGVSR